MREFEDVTKRLVLVIVEIFRRSNKSLFYDKARQAMTNEYNSSLSLCDSLREFSGVSIYMYICSLFGANENLMQCLSLALAGSTVIDNVASHGQNFEHYQVSKSR